MQEALIRSTFLHSSKLIKSKSNALAVVFDAFSEIVIPTAATA